MTEDIPETVELAMLLPEWQELNPTEDELEMVCTASSYESPEFASPQAVVEFVKEQRGRPAPPWL
ncbi:hypothetical protein HQ563_03285 [bacterium]|nr:hypothetical protein [bacterium]